MNLIEILEKEEMARLTAGKTIPAFRAGDTVIVSVNVVEGSRKRVQAFEGVVIARRTTTCANVPARPPASRNVWSARKPNPRRWETCLETPESLRRLRGFYFGAPFEAVWIF